MNIELLTLADEAKEMLKHANTENFVIWQAEQFIKKVEPILRQLAWKEDDE
jgi:hypothetical protein